MRVGPAIREAPWRLVTVDSPAVVHQRGDLTGGTRFTPGPGPSKVRTAAVRYTDTGER